MDVDTNNTHSQKIRISECEVCAKKEAKYTCPRCELRTCCLECNKIHKKELECSGLRDKVKFKMLKSFDNIDLLNDYRLLEETARVASKSVKLPAISCYNGKHQNLPPDLYRLKCTALSRGIQLHFLPPIFSRRCTNTSYLDHEAQNLFWRVDWVFPQAGDLTLTDEKVLDSTLLSACVHKYVDPEEGIHPSLSFYQAAGHIGIQLLLKADRIAPNRYYRLDSSITLRENLDGKSIIEYPVIYVVLSDHIYMFNMLTEEEEQKFRKKRRRRHQARNNSAARSNHNFLFSNGNDAEAIELNGETSGTEDSSKIEVNNGYDRPNKQPSFADLNRGRGRGRYNSRKNWNQRRHSSHIHKRNETDCSEKSVDRLSNNLSSLNTQSHYNKYEDY